MTRKPCLPRSNTIPSAAVRFVLAVRLLSAAFLLGATSQWVLGQQQAPKSASFTADSTAKSVPKPASFEPGRLERVKALGNPMLEGSIPTYYTPGYEKRARKLQTFFSDELQFAQRHMQFSLVCFASRAGFRPICADRTPNALSDALVHGQSACGNDAGELGWRA